eukprot:CAMPEP_0206042842 /NCGR_PEP_ID=MMETSP1466-20131121/6797_1 /ASSEMBLY_ACC=CAM_ASM_001126 /TAXON_ID=44452 /ORGANISM="Pavlova gyrans, Strain CCMP608" /LENGTH=1218 /DNA_ID=CAMNT_0053417565 /DNA_START=519 /DNA_END=4176 /DNA_ORIENTATION=+
MSVIFSGSIGGNRAGTWLPGLIPRYELWMAFAGRAQGSSGRAAASIGESRAPPPIASQTRPVEVALQALAGMDIPEAALREHKRNQGREDYEIDALIAAIKNEPSKFEQHACDRVRALAAAVAPAPSLLTEREVLARLEGNHALTTLRRAAVSVPAATKAAMKQHLKDAAAAIDEVIKVARDDGKDKWSRLRTFLLESADQMSSRGAVAKAFIAKLDDKLFTLMGERPGPASVPRRDLEDDIEDLDSSDTDEPALATPDDESEDSGPSEGPGELSDREFVRPQTPPPADAPAVVQRAFRIVMDIAELRRSLRFDLYPYLRRAHDHIASGFARLGERGDNFFTEPWKRMLGGGKCQSRKTPIKLVTIILCRLMGVASVVITTGVPGRQDIFSKFLALLDGVDVPSPNPVREMSAKAFQYEELARSEGRLPKLVEANGARRAETFIFQASDASSPRHADWVSDTLLKGGCVVTNHSAAAVNKAARLVHNAQALSQDRRRSDVGTSAAPPAAAVKRSLQFALILDEADDLYRTGAFREGQASARIEMEKALRALRALGPLLHLEVTATPLSIYVIYRELGEATGMTYADIVHTDSSCDYVGVEMFKPPVAADGSHVFLARNDLKVSNCYVNPKVRELWREAGRHDRALCLDATSPAVTARSNIYAKAKLLVDEVPRAIAVIVSGKEIRWYTRQPKPRRPQDAHGTAYTGKERIIGTILDTIDREYPRRPIFIFGYSQLARGISYRSRLRVPSHFVLALGKNMSLCRLVQAAGRANGDQAMVLRKNGFSHVTLLTLHHDYDLICNYPAFIGKIKEHMAQGRSLHDAMGEPVGYLPVVDRSLGAKKLELNVSDHVAIARPRPGEAIGADAEDADLVRGRCHARAVLEVLLDLDARDDANAVTAKAVQEELAANPAEYDRYRAGDDDELPSKLSIADVRSILKGLAADLPHREGLVIEEKNGAGRRNCCVFFVDEDVLGSLFPHEASGSSADCASEDAGPAVAGLLLGPSAAHGAGAGQAPAAAGASPSCSSDEADDEYRRRRHRRGARSGPRQQEMERARKELSAQDEGYSHHLGAGTGDKDSPLVVDCDLTDDDDDESVHLGHPQARRESGGGGSGVGSGSGLRQSQHPPTCPQEGTAPAPSRAADAKPARVSATSRKPKRAVDDCTRDDSSSASADDSAMCPPPSNGGGKQARRKVDAAVTKVNPTSPAAKPTEVIVIDLR